MRRYSDLADQSLLAATAPLLVSGGMRAIVLAAWRPLLRPVTECFEDQCKGG